MADVLTTDNCQLIYCAVCLEVQSELAAKGLDPQLAITLVYGTAVCEEHRRRVDGFSQAVFGAKRFHTRGDDNFRRGPR
jgi:hypothetical protein